MEKETPIYKIQFRYRFTKVKSNCQRSWAEFNGNKNDSEQTSRDYGKFHPAGFSLKAGQDGWRLSGRMWG